MFANLFRKSGAHPAQEVLDAFGRVQGMITFDLTGTILEVNDQFIAVMGYSRAELIGQKHAMFLLGDEASSPAYKIFWEKLRGGEAHVDTFARRAKNGARVWLEAAYCPVLGPDGVPVKVVKIARDVTSQRNHNATIEGQIKAISKSSAVTERFATDNAVGGGGPRVEERAPAPLPENPRGLGHHREAVD